MKKALLASFMMIVTSMGYAQDSNRQVTQLQNEIHELKREVSSYASTIEKNKRSISSLSTSLSTSQKEVKNLQDELGMLKSNVSKLEDSLKSTDEKFSKEISSTNKTVDDNEKFFSSELQEKTVYGTIGIMVAIILGVFLFYIIRKRMTQNVNVIEGIKKAQDELKKAQDALEEESIKLDNKMIELIDKQINSSNVKVDNVTDHSLALKVADEIVRIELNLSRMDASVKGHKQLSKGVERIKNNFLAKGYEIADMLNKPYNEGMRINADFVLDETLEQGTRIITSITKPQVTYKGELIQKAIVTVNQNI